MRRLGFAVAALCAVACSREPHAAPLFKSLSPGRTGITFANTITTTDSVNVQTDVFVYNGAGVAVGDIDNDGLPDIFLSGNMVSSRLYLNKGDMRFEDITEHAGVTTHRWATGASMVDINSDGYLDIYVSVSGPKWSRPEQRANLLFLNNGDRTFTEVAARYGVADTGFTTHAVFFDYNGDRSLDLFLLNNSPEEFARGEAELHPAGVRSQSSGSYDQLYRNNGDGTFTNVSTEAGILKVVDFGLGVVVCDLNRDGWPDIYVSNDDTPDDVLYVNNGNGTFSDKATAWLKHTSFAGMGMDIADFNNDGWPDILQTDMMPESLPGRKRMSGAITYSDVLERRRRGFHEAYNLNTLQLSNGVTRGGDLAFSEIARLAGVAYTDWSWSALFGDYDNDGFKDVFITNGYPKAVTDFDYQTAMFRRRPLPGFDILHNLRTYKAASYLFRNNGDLTFTNNTKEWGMGEPGFAYGTAQADLNNDGKLDLVVNNIDAPASIFENVQANDEAHHYLAIELRGDSPDNGGLGAKLTLVAAGRRQYVDYTPYHGYMSSMATPVHFGLGAATRVDSLEVGWPDGRAHVLTDLQVDGLLVLTQRDATPRRPTPDTRDHIFQPAPANTALRYQHRGTPFVDYTAQALLPDMPSRQGPPLAVGDMNGDGLDDVFIGGAAGVPGKLFLQNRNGGFAESAHGQPWAADTDYEDWGAQLFDANGDGRLDLYVASGGYQLSPVSRFLQDRLYINRGHGRFVRDSAALPSMLTSTASVAVGDFTGDGRPDLFVGGRLVPRNYPYPARSYLLRNEGGRFTDVTEQVAPELAKPFGMITAAVWIDFDRDGRLDLVTAGEWTPLQFFKNDGRRLRNVSDAMHLPPTRGWWFNLASGDFNGDGRPDLVAGNLGLNHTYTTSDSSKFGIYAADFTGNGNTDIVLTKQIEGQEYPLWGLATLGRNIYTVGLRFPTYESFSTASVPQIFGASELQRALHYQIDTFASLYLQNNGDGTFAASPLPNLAQISPIRGIVAHDVDRDGNLDLTVAGNLYDMEPNTPRADAGNGLLLKGDGRGHFAPVAPWESGFLTPLDVTGLARIHTPRGEAVLVTNYGDSLQTFSITTHCSAATCFARLPGSTRSESRAVGTANNAVSPSPPR